MSISILEPTLTSNTYMCTTVMDFLGEDIWSELLSVVGKKNAEELAAKSLSPGGKAFLQLNELEKNIEGSNSTLKSGKLSIADVYIFAATGWYASGFMTKATNVQSLFNGRPKLKAICTRVGQLPAIKAHQHDENNTVHFRQAYSMAPWTSKL